MKSEDQKETPFEESGASTFGGDLGDDSMVSGIDDEAADGTDDPASDPVDELAAAQEAAAAAHDLYLRERAELENFKRRSMRERSDALRYAAEPLARDLIPVVDNLERALEHGRGDGAREGADASLIAGIELVLKGAIDVLQRHGVERFDATGELFDPAAHEAVARLPHDTVEANHVVEQLVCGYRLHDRLLRAAQVCVSTGSATGE